MFGVNRSFYPEKSHHITIYFKVIFRLKVLVEGDFIILVSIDYKHAYAVELCSSLAILKFIDYLLD